MKRAAAAVVSLLMLAACTTPNLPEPSTPPAPSTTAAPVSTGSETEQLLSSLPVKGRAPKTGYDRDLFGPAWTDDVNIEGGHNGCDTRNDILRRDLLFEEPAQGCRVSTGLLHDPYTGETISFIRGQTTSDDVQIDHVVALSDAWQTGAQQLAADERKEFANDPLNLQATAGPVNQRKGDADAATWLPPDRSYWCEYVTIQVQVKARYDLWVKPAERDRIAQVLQTC